MNWHDISSYSKGQETREIQTVELEIRRDFSIIVSRHIRYPGKWLASTRDKYFLPQTELLSNSLEDAKREALLLVFNRLDDFHKAVGRLIQ